MIDNSIKGVLYGIAAALPVFLKAANEITKQTFALRDPGNCQLSHIQKVNFIY